MLKHSIGRELAVIMTAMIFGCTSASEDRQSVAETGGVVEMSDEQAKCHEKLPQVQIGIRSDWKDVIKQSTVPAPRELVAKSPGEQVSFELTAFHEPHCFIYKDQHLTFVNPNAGFNWALGTRVGLKDGRVDTITVPAAPRLLALDEAIEFLKSLLEDFKEQGLGQKISTNGGPIFLVRVASQKPKPLPPGEFSSFEQMRAAYLNSELFLEDVLVSVMESEGITVVVRLRNLRRRTSGVGYKTEAVQMEMQEMNESDLLREEVYFIQIEFGRKDSSEIVSEWTAPDPTRR